MASESVKGSLVLGVAVAVRRLRDRGRITPDALEVRLSGPALALIDQKIEIARWYPIGVFCELLELDWEVSGHRDPMYLERQGAVSADRLFDSRMYQQLDYAERTGRVESRTGLARQAKLITTITGSLYDFLDFQVSLNSRSLDIVYGNARSFVDALIPTTVGFMNQINLRQGSKRRWTGKRLSPDQVRFRMELPERFAEEA